MSELLIRFGQLDPVAKGDIQTITTSPIKPWNTINSLKEDNIQPPALYATGEWNYTIADGNMGEFPDNPNGTDWGFWSDEFSDESGLFASPPTLDMAFSVNHKSVGLTFYFYPNTDDYARNIRVTWYDSSNNVIYTDEYAFTSPVGVLSENVADWRRIKVEFLETNIRNRFLKLYALDFGVLRTFTDTEISSCQVLEEIDPTVETISINTLNATIRTRDSIFSPITSADFTDMMMKRQPMDLIKDGILFGKFYLEKWVDPYQSGIEFDLEAGDAVSVLDLYTFDGGLYSNTPVTAVLTAIFDLAFPTHLVTYELDPEYQSSTLTGYIPICSCGEAFQHVMFALHAVADTSRRANVWIYPADTAVTYEINRLERYRRGQDEPTEYYSGVRVISYSYSASTVATDLFNDTLTVGRHRIDGYSGPHASYTVTGATIAVSHVNYVELSVAVAGKVNLRGIPYLENTQVHKISEEVTAGEAESVMDYEGYTLVNPGIALYIAQKELDWLKNRIRSESEIVLDNREVGYIARVETTGIPLQGTIISLDSNLRANKSDMVVIGNAVD